MSLDDKKVINKRRSGKTSHCHGQSARQLSNRLRSIYSTHLYTSVFTVQAIGQRILDTGLPLLYKTCTADPALHCVVCRQSGAETCESPICAIVISLSRRNSNITKLITTLTHR